MMYSVSGLGAEKVSLQTYDVPQGLKRVLKVASWRKDVPQRLKPHCRQGSCGTGKPVPLSKTDFSADSSTACDGMRLGKTDLSAAFEGVRLGKGLWRFGEQATAAKGLVGGERLEGGGVGAEFLVAVLELVELQ